MIILLNGPPGSGKDTVGKYIAEKYGNCTIEKFALPIKKMIQTVFNLTPEQFEYVDSQKNKNSPQELLCGKSSREIQIEFAENFMKKTFDNTIFSKLLVKRLNCDKNVVIPVTDLGFHSEIDHIVESRGDVIVVHLHRENCRFINRSYVRHPNACRNYRIDNDFSLEVLYKNIDTFMHTLGF